ncbi:hypothetical protein F5884DRAFT_670914, partial [Xylogone sp. PMI_703]
RLDCLGLTVLYESAALPTLDFIFVRGLGGSSRQTWSKDHDPELFRPQIWLSLEPKIQTARTLTFGYNANFLGPASISRISDFARDLLCATQFMHNDSDAETHVGKRPIVFVAHSIVGLVVKKAYILGQNDDIHKNTLVSVKSIIFLSTPHRGSNLAPIHDRVLKLSVFNYFSKQCISELERGLLPLKTLMSISLCCS